MEVEAKTLVRLEKASITRGGVYILKDADFELKDGQNWAVLGPNGSGKTTMLKLLRGDIRPLEWHTRSYAHELGMINSPMAFKNNTGLVTPHVLDQFRHMGWNMTGLFTVCSGFIHGGCMYQLPNQAQKDKAHEVLERLGLTHLVKAKVLELSLGQSMGLLVARALVHDPKVLFLDECCQALDAAARDRLLGWLETLAAGGTQLVFATHREDELVPAISHVLRIDRGKIVEKGPREAVLGKDDGAARRGAGLKSWNVAGACLGRKSRAVIKLCDSDVAIEGKKVLWDLNWTVRPGEHWAVLGHNGAGKSTLLNLIIGDLRPSWGGSIERFLPDNPGNIWDIRKRVGLVHALPNLYHLPEQSGLDMVLTGFFSSHFLLQEKVTPEQEAKALAVMRLLGADNLARRNIHILSNGQLRRLMIARSMVLDPEMLLLDEPFRGLDARARDELTGLLNKLAAKGVTLIYVTHHADELVPATTHVAVLKKGRMTYQGPVGEFMASELAANWQRGERAA